jgi:hypothetical protein
MTLGATNLRGRQHGEIAVRAHILVLVLMLGGCSSSSEIVLNWSGGPVPDLSEPDHRRVVAENIRKIFPNQTPNGEMHISGVRPVDHLKGPAWLTCLKIDNHTRPQYYAIFIQGAKIVDWRAALVIDQCYRDTYLPFEAAAPAKPNS